jgi:hypothetical protein
MLAGTAVLRYPSGSVVVALIVAVYPNRLIVQLLIAMLSDPPTTSVMVTEGALEFEQLIVDELPPPDGWS